MTKEINLVISEKISIFEQLKLEEALIRASDQNWCLITRGSNEAIVMGISSQVADDIDEARLQQRPIPIIRRFSGGGTVVVDKNCLFVSFIFNKEEFPFAANPKEALFWSHQFYKSVFAPIELLLHSQDYVIGDRKIGGNGQYFTKNRALHHTSFLWDFSPDLMNLLRIPKMAPPYRQGRPHEEFVTKLALHFPTLKDFTEKLEKNIQSQFCCIPVSLEEASLHLTLPHRKACVSISA